MLFSSRGVGTSQSGCAGCLRGRVGLGRPPISHAFSARVFRSTGTLIVTCEEMSDVKQIVTLEFSAVCAGAVAHALLDSFWPFAVATW